MDKRNNIQLMLFQGQFNRSYVHLRARERREEEEEEKKASIPLDVYTYLIDSSNSKKKVVDFFLFFFRN